MTHLLKRANFDPEPVSLLSCKIHFVFVLVIMHSLHEMVK